MAQNTSNTDKLVNETHTKNGITFKFSDQLNYKDSTDDLDFLGIDQFIDNNFDFMKEVVQHIEGKPVDVTFEDSIKSIERNAVINEIFKKRMEFLKKS